MNQRKPKTVPKSKTHGLSLCGTIIDRSRRMVPLDNPTTEIVTYTIQDEYDRKFYVDDFAPSEYHDLNDNVCFPVYVKAYSKKNGNPSYTLNVQKEDPVKRILTRGEHF